MERVLITNRKARHDYAIEDTYEAGLVLSGTEIKSIRAGRANLLDAFARVENGEVWLYNMHVSPYPQGGMHNPDPYRRRKLLLNKQEIRKLARATDDKGMTLIPLRVYLKDQRAKIELATARGKRQYEKRDAIADREAKREMDRAMRRRR